jgi:hypothetical protein
MRTLLVTVLSLLSTVTSSSPTWQETLERLRSKVKQRGSSRINTQFTKLDDAIRPSMKLGDAAAKWRHVSASDSRAGLELSDAVDSRAQFCSAYKKRRKSAVSKMIHKLVNLDVYLSGHKWSACTHGMDPETGRIVQSLDDPEIFVRMILVFATEMERRFPDVAAMGAFAVLKRYITTSTHFLTSAYSDYFSANLVTASGSPLRWLKGVEKCMRGEPLLVCDRRDETDNSCVVATNYTSHIGKTGGTAIFLRKLVQKFTSIAVDLDTAMYYARLDREVSSIGVDRNKVAEAGHHQQSCDDLFAHSEELRFDDIDRSELLSSDEFAIQELVEIANSL